ncbi:MAG TPA: SCO family protein [Polyangiaceae bacterium]|nr:SCO family protein [Polyangiaceae bacterium]
MTRHLRCILFTLGLVLLGGVRPAFATTPNGGPPRIDGPRPIMAGKVPEELDGIGIEDKAGADLPRDLELTGSDGRKFTLGEYMDGDRPLVLVLAYYNCPMLCSLVLNGANEALSKIPEAPGADYRFLVVSFDERDHVDVAHDKRASYVGNLKRPIQPIEGSDVASYEFAVGDPKEVRRLADAVGFRYRWDEEQQQFAHAAGLFFVTPKGKLSTVLTGIKFEPDDVSASLREATKGESHSPLNSVLLYCFQYNPHTGRYVLAAGRAMRVGAGITMGALAIVLFRMFRAERKKRKAPASKSSDPKSGGDAADTESSATSSE